MSNLRDTLAEADSSADLAVQFAARIAGVLDQRKVSAPDAVRALVVNIAAIVKARSGPSEWPEVARIIADEMREQIGVPLSRDDVRPHGSRLILPVRLAG